MRDRLLEALHYTGVGPTDLLVDGGIDPLALPATAADLAAIGLDADTPVQTLQAAWSLHGIETTDALVEPPPEGALADWCPRRRDKQLLRRLDPAVVAAVAHLVAVTASVEANLPPLDVPTARHAVEVAAAPGSRAERFLRDDAATAAGLWSDVQLAAAAGASTTALATVLTAGDELSGRDARWPEQATELWTDAGRVWIGSPGPDTFTAPFTIVLDPGGDDHYAGDAAPQRIAIVVDLAGDDTYQQMPAAVGGVVLIVDAAGDDDHRGDTLGPAGAAWGASVLFDRDGDDRYAGGPWSLGAALYGVGLLLDGAGDDAYSGVAPTQGVAAAGGVGLLADRSGHDRYDARGQGEAGAQGYAAGLGPWYAGGIGALIDGAGDDRYAAGRGAQGYGTHGGLGVLVDRAGDDHYAAIAWAQGVASHLGRGVLLDEAGADRYDVGHSGQGRAHDRAAALLWDPAGDDRYRGENAVQGYASGNAVALLVDGGGDDRFDAGGALAAWGAATPLRGAGSIALLLDAGGSDRYQVPSPIADGDARWTHRHGLTLDRGRPARPQPVDTPSDAIPAQADEVDALLDDATSPDPARAAAALARLTAGGPALWPALRARLRADEPATAAAIGAVLTGIAGRSTEDRTLLAEQLSQDLDPATASAQASHLLIGYAQVADPADAAVVAGRFLEHGEPAVRAAATAVLGRACGDDQVALLLHALTGDADPHVRATAARSLGCCPAPAPVAPLAAALEAPQLAVRDNAARSLVELARTGARDEVRAAVRAPAATGSIPALEVLARVPDTASRPALELLLQSEDPAIRGHAALALGAIGDSLSRKALMGREAVEADPFVSLCLDRALRTPGNPAAIAPPLP